MIALQGMAGFKKDNLKQGIGKLAYLKVDIGKIQGKFPWMSEIPLQGNGMSAIPKSIYTFHICSIKTDETT